MKITDTPHKSIRWITFFSVLTFLPCPASCDADENAEASGTNIPTHDNTPAAYHRGNNKSMNNTLKITVGPSIFTAVLADNTAATSFKNLLPLTISMNDVNGNEKYYNLPQSLPTATANAKTIHAGDLMLWGSHGLVLFYKTFTSSYKYTPIGRIDDASGLAAALDGEKTTVTFELK